MRTVKGLCGYLVGLALGIGMYQLASESQRGFLFGMSLGACLIWAVSTWEAKHGK